MQKIYASRVRNRQLHSYCRIIQVRFVFGILVPNALTLRDDSNRAEYRRKGRVAEQNRLVEQVLLGWDTVEPAPDAVVACCSTRRSPATYDGGAAHSRSAGDPDILLEWNEPSVQQQHSVCDKVCGSLRFPMPEKRYRIQPRIWCPDHESGNEREGFARPTTSITGEPAWPR